MVLQQIKVEERHCTFVFQKCHFYYPSQPFMRLILFQSEEVLLNLIIFHYNLKLLEEEIATLLAVDINPMNKVAQYLGKIVDEVFL